MRRIFKVVIILIVIGLLGYMVYQIAGNIKARKELSEQIQSLPDFEFQVINGEVFKSSDIKVDLPVVVVYFNPNCEECQYEIQQIRDNISLFQDVQILLVSPVKKEVLLEFYDKYNLDKYSQITVLLDHKDNFHTVFGPASYPTIFIYNKLHQLIKRYKGETKVEAVLKALQEN